MSETPIVDAELQYANSEPRIVTLARRLERDRAELIALLQDLADAGVFDLGDTYSQRARALLSRLEKDRT